MLVYLSLSKFFSSSCWMITVFPVPVGPEKSTWRSFLTRTCSKKALRTVSDVGTMIVCICASLGMSKPVIFFCPHLPFVRGAEKVFEASAGLRQREFGHRPHAGFIANESVLFLHWLTQHEQTEEAVELGLSLLIGGAAEAPEESHPEERVQLQLLLLDAQVLRIRVEWQLLHHESQVELQEILHQPIAVHRYRLLHLALQHLPSAINGGDKQLLDHLSMLLDPLR
mmetsp:Transcript_10385/g.18283  ORF Transcript_10385/g.18283 Transcript_10385/m.18283 type:complete len:226 (-) Transcript_10385:3158-3835(-)